MWHSGKYVSPECTTVVEHALLQHEMRMTDDRSSAGLEMYQKLKAAANESLAAFAELAMRC